MVDSVILVADEDCESSLEAMLAEWEGGFGRSDFSNPSNPPTARSSSPANVVVADTDVVCAGWGAAQCTLVAVVKRGDLVEQVVWYSNDLLDAKICWFWQLGVLLMEDAGLVSGTLMEKQATTAT